MKRAFVFLLAAVLAAGVCLPAAAAGKLAAIHENLYAIPYYTSGIYATLYAEVANEGDKPVEFATGLVEFFDKDGNSVESVDVEYCYPGVLQPGEHGFISVSKYIETTDLTLVADHMLSLTGKGKITANIARLEASARIETTTDAYYPTTRLIATIKNSTEKAVQDISAVFAVKDAAGEILYIANNTWNGYNIKLLPGSSIEMSMDLYSDTVTYFSDHNLVPAAVDIVAWAALAE
jgi:hypothetical protein